MSKKNKHPLPKYRVVEQTYGNGLKQYEVQTNTADDFSDFWWDHIDVGEELLCACTFMGCVFFIWALAIKYYLFYVPRKWELLPTCGYASKSRAISVMKQMHEEAIERSNKLIAIDEEKAKEKYNRTIVKSKRVA